MRRWLAALAAAGLVLAGCAEQRPTGGAPAGPLPDLALRAGMVVKIAPAVAGLDPRTVHLAGGRGEKTVRVAALDTASMSLTWTETRQELTPASRLEQAEWERQKAAAPVGAAPPPRPEPAYEAVGIAGKLRVAAPAAGARPAAVMAPGLWPAGEELVRDGDSAIWLSRHAFTELAGARRTAWNATAFDSLVFSALDSFGDMLAAYRRMADRLSPEQQAALRELTAEAEPGSLRVRVNGQETTLETIRARNWFVDLHILNNPDNPLVLKATFNPLSDGPLGVFSPLAAFKALLGFQVTEIQLP